MVDTTPLRKKLLDLAVNGKLVKKQGGMEYNPC